MKGIVSEEWPIWIYMSAVQATNLLLGTLLWFEVFYYSNEILKHRVVLRLLYG